MIANLQEYGSIYADAAQNGVAQRGLSLTKSLAASGPATSLF